jgi:hypothetical protein
MDMTTKLMLSVFASAFGMGYFVYGKKQQRIVALISGITLCLYPYFVSNIYIFIVTAFMLLALPFVVRY